MWAVLWTDLLQFILKMSMVILLAYFAVHAIGGMGALTAQVHAFDAAHGAGRDTLAFIPSTRLAVLPELPGAAELELVGELVSGRRAGRRRLHCAAHLFGEGREAFAGGDAVVQHCALCAAAVAVDPDGAGGAGAAAQSDGGAGRHGRRVRVGDGPLPAAEPARADAGRVCRGVHVHHRHASEPRRVVHDQRHLQAVFGARPQANATTSPPRASPPSWSPS